MKETLAIIVAFAFLVVGWAFLSALLFGVMYIASRAREGVGLLHLVNLLLMWVLAPGFGAFCATYATPRIFRSVDAATIAIGFISVATTLATVIFLLSFIVQEEKSSIGRYVVFVAQVAAIIIGA